MGKGDQRTRRGKIWRGTFGKRRPKRDSPRQRNEQRQRFGGQCGAVKIFRRIAVPGGPFGGHRLTVFAIVIQSRLFASLPAVIQHTPPEKPVLKRELVVGQ